MKFEDFEKKLWEKGYGIAAFNHYPKDGDRYTYCAVFNVNINKVYKSEGRESEKVFDSIINQINN